MRAGQLKLSFQATLTCEDPQPESPMLDLRRHPYRATLTSEDRLPSLRATRDDQMFDLHAQAVTLSSMLDRKRHPYPQIESPIFDQKRQPFSATLTGEGPNLTLRPNLIPAESLEGAKYSPHLVTSGTFSPPGRGYASRALSSCSLSTVPPLIPLTKATLAPWPMPCWNGFMPIKR